MIRPRSDGVAGALLLVAAALIALETRTFTVRFLTDPIGPKALPFLVAACLAVGGVVLIVRPQAGPVWPGRHVWVRGAVAVLSFGLYAYLISGLGFMLATTLEVAALAVIFRGPPVKALLAAAAYSVILYLLFAYGLGLPLPLGTLFVSGS